MTKATDSLQKCISENGEAVIYALDATCLVQEAMERINAWPPATNHLGQAMMATLLLQALADSESNETISLQWMCEGPFGHLYAEARNYGEVRGTIRQPRPVVADYETTLGQGLLQVRRTRGARSTSSVVHAVGSVSLDLVEYLEQSEQKNCGMNLSVVVEWADEHKQAFRVRSALAFLVHILPQDTEPKLHDALARWNRQIEGLGPISRWSLREDQVTLDMLRLLSGEPEPILVMTQRISFRCNCNSERAARALALLEAQEEKDGQRPDLGSTEIRCEYCGKTYTIQAGQTDALKRPTRPKKRAGKKKKKT